MSRRREARRGRWLAPVATEKLLGGTGELAELDARLTAEGWTRAGTVRPYLARNGWITLRFVWRKREEGLSRVWTETFRVNSHEVRAAQGAAS